MNKWGPADVEHNVCVSCTVHIRMNINGTEESSIRRDEATNKSSQGNAPGDKRRLLYSHTHGLPHSHRRETWVEMSVLRVRVSRWMHVCMCADTGECWWWNVCLSDLMKLCVFFGIERLYIHPVLCGCYHVIYWCEFRWMNGKTTRVWVPF